MPWKCGCSQRRARSQWRQAGEAKLVSGIDVFGIASITQLVALRETEDALVALIEQQAKRDALYAESREELNERFQFGRMGGVA
jgi:hypothetical protein